MPVVVVNPTAPVGPWDVKPTPTGKIVLDFMRGRIPAYLATGMNLVDVADVSAGHILAMEQGRIGHRYILGNRNVTLKEMFGMLSRITGRPAPRVRLPYWLVVGAGYAEQAVSGGLLGRQPTIPVEGVLASKKPAWVSQSAGSAGTGIAPKPGGAGAGTGGGVVRRQRLRRSKEGRRKVLKQNPCHPEPVEGRQCWTD